MTTLAYQEPHGFERRIDQYVDAMRVMAFSALTILNRQRRLLRFVEWCAERGIFKPGEVTRPILERYQRFIMSQLHPRTGAPLKIISQRGMLNDLRAFFRWLTRQNHILYNPAADLDMPRNRKVFRPALTLSEVEEVLKRIDPKDVQGLRTRTIFEVLYSTAIRRMELIKLKVHDVDLDKGVVFIAEGKFGKSRFVPIGRRAVEWVRKYLEDARPRLVVPPDDGELFLSPTGRAMSANWLTQMVGQHIRSTGVTKPGGPHLLRHTCATLMLEGGADIRYIQAMLGHVSLETTQIYTHATIKKLKEVHDLTHPAKLYNKDDDYTPPDLPETSAELGPDDLGPDGQKPTL